MIDIPTFGLEGDIYILQHFHRVWAAAFLLGIEEDVALLGDGSVDHVEENGAESLFHVRSDPDEEPIVKLDTGGKYGADTGASTDRDTATVQMGEVGKAGKLYAGLVL